MSRRGRAETRPLPTCSQRRARSLAARAYQIDGEEAFDAVMASSGDRLVILNCSATWCGPCKLFKPTYNLFAEEYTQAHFLSVTGDKNESTNKLMKRLAVKTVPAFFFYKNGEQVSGPTEDVPWIPC